MTKLNTLSATEAARRIARREITCEQLIRDYLERIAERDREVQAWQYIDPEAALAQARVLDRGPLRGPLHGIPLGVKDVFETYDMPTEHGTPIYTGNRTTNDAATVAVARHGGMVILGKTVSTELAASAPSKTRNPRNLAHTPGGSSAGSAAAVADNMVAIALGTQTVGSTIRPASFCGVVGYKPTFNLLSRAGVKVEGDSLDTIGLFARAVPDVALYAGVQTNDARMINLAQAGPGLRIGTCKTHQWDRVQPEMAAAMERGAKDLAAAGARVSEVTLPKPFATLLDAHMSVYLFEMWRAFADEYLRAADKLTPLLRGKWEEGSRITNETYQKALAHARACRAALPEIFGELDVLLVPSARGEAPKGFETTGDPVMNQIWSILYAPAVTVPVAKGPNGLPVGLQVIGRIGEDARALSAAHWIHQALGR
jgi:Asp-tRNA(Asn)/Glu-tRNA(Gln) amidotransferase A subunit family amidase